MTSHPDKNELKLAWMALAARAQKGKVVQLDAELLASFVEGKCSAEERSTVVSSLANDPAIWSTWKSLALERDDASPIQTANSRWYQPFFKLSALPKWGLAAAFCLVAFIGLRFMDLDNGSDNRRLPSLAIDWLKAFDTEQLRLPLMHSPFVRVGRGVELPPDTEGYDALFRSGFQRGQAEVVHRLAKRSAEWIDAASKIEARRDQTCDKASSDCTVAFDSGVIFGVWASSTALHCRSGNSDDAMAEVEKIRVLSKDRSGGIPDDFPEIPSNESDICTYTARLVSKYGVIL